MSAPCSQRGRLIELGPEALGEHLHQCPHCQADATRVDEAMADLWDDLDDFLDAEPPMVVGAGAPPVPANEPLGPRSRWPALGVVVAAAAVLLLVAWPVLQPVLLPQSATEGEEDERREAPEEPEEPVADPLEAEPEGPEVHPLDQAKRPDDGVAEADRAPRGSPEGVVARPEALDTGLVASCPTVRQWWRWTAPVPGDCLVALTALAGPDVVAIAQKLAAAQRLHRDEAEQLIRVVMSLSAEGRHDDAVTLAARVAELRSGAGTWRTATLAAREWMLAASGDEAERRRRIALSYADRWTALAPPGNASAHTVRDSLVRTREERALCPPLIGQDHVPGGPCAYDHLSDRGRVSLIVTQLGVDADTGIAQLRTIRQHGRLGPSLALGLAEAVPAADLHRILPQLLEAEGARTDRLWLPVWSTAAQRLDERRRASTPTPDEAREAYEVARVWASMDPDDLRAVQVLNRLTVK